MVILEDEADGPTAQPGRFPFIQRARILIRENNSSGARGVEQADDVEQRGLAGTGWTDQRGKLAALQREVDAVQNLHLQRRT